VNAELSVIIVTWNSANDIERCLSSLLAHSRMLTQEIIVVDNASKDGTPRVIQEKFEQIRLIGSQENLGFAQACNRGIEESRGQFLWLLNPDTELVNDAPSLLAQALVEKREAGIAGAMLYDGAGLPTVSYGDFPDWWYVVSRLFPMRRLFPDAWLPQYGRTPRATEKEVRQVDWISGANLFFRREVLQRAGRLHPRFFAFFEDVDFCRRARHALFRSYLVPQSKVIHYGARSFSQRPKTAKHIFLESELLYFRRHLRHPDWARRLFLVKTSLTYLEAVLTRKQERRAFLQQRLETLRRRLPTKGGFSIASHDDRQSEIEFSIIIPVYNRARLLPRAVRSILEQRGVSLHRIEAVICDDGSTDNPREVLEEMLGKAQEALPIQIVWISLAHSGFPGPVRNAGMAVARGRIIAFLDSDDRWLADHLRTMKGAFDRNPELGMVITGFRFSQLAYAADGRLIETYQKPPHTPRSIITDCVAIRRSVVSQMGGFGEEDFAEDYYYWHRLMSEIEVRRLRRKTAVFSFLRRGDHLSYRFERLRSRYA